MVTIRLDKERHLLRTMRGMKLFREKTGKSMLKGFDPETLTEDDITAMLWSMLIHEDKGLKIEQVEEMVEGVDAQEVIRAVASALGLIPG